MRIKDGNYLFTLFLMIFLLYLRKRVGLKRLLQNGTMRL